MSQDSSPEEIIQNLLHLDLSKRKTGFLQVKSHWMIEYREYLYTAIESERNSQLQFEMVNFVLLQLKDKSLRKMIRFLESEKLQLKSRQSIIKSYLNYENQTVREALIKSLLRPDSKISTFIVSIFNSPELLQIWGEDPTRIYTLLTDSTNSEIPKDRRIDIIHAFFSRYIIQSTFRGRVGTKIWSILKEYPDLHSYILLEFFDIQYLSDNKSKVKLSWHNWSWKVEGSSLRHQGYRRQFSEYDEFLLDSVNGPESVAMNAIPILGSFNIPPPPFHSREYEDNLNQLWNTLIDRNAIDSLIEYEEITSEDLKLLSEQVDLPFKELDLELNLHEFMMRIYAYLPRYSLIKLLTSKNSKIRSEVYKYLVNPSFFYADELILTPSHFWLKFSENAFKHTEYRAEEIDNLSNFIFFLLKFTGGITNETISNSIFQPIYDHLTSNSLLKGSEFWTIHYFLAFHNQIKIPDVPKKGIISELQYELIIDHFFFFSSPDVLIPLMIHILDHFPYNLVQKLLNYISEREFVNGLEPLLAKLSEHSDVRIRAKLRLVMKKFPLGIE